MIRLRLPDPISLHKYYKHSRYGGLYITEEGKAFKTKVQYLIYKERITLLKVPVKINIILCQKDNRHRDEDNFAGKALYDAIKRDKTTGIGIIEDDSLIYERRCIKIKGKEAYCEIEVEPLSEEDLEARGWGLSMNNNKLIKNK